MGFREAWPGILVATTLAAVATIAACGSAVTGPSTSCTTVSGRACTVDASVKESGVTLASPPPPGPMQPADGTGTVTLALTSLLGGGTGLDGGSDTTGWELYGYNIDGVAPGNPAAFCVPAAGGSASLVHQEGPNGIENAFGHLVLPLLEPVVTDVCLGCGPPDPLDTFRPLLSLEKLGSASSYDPVSAQVALGGHLGHAPLWDGTDLWPVVQGTSSSLSASYLVNDTWVSGPIASLSLPIDLTALLTLDIHHAVLTMKVDQARTSASGGMLSGVITTSDLQKRLQSWAGAISLSLCSGSALEGLLTDVAQASDIMQDGTQDPAKTCDGISIGLGFEATVVQLGPTVPAVTMPDPCVGDGGADG